MTALDLQISVEAGGWPPKVDIQALAENVLGKTAAFLQANEAQPFPAMAPELSLVFTDDAAIREISAEWRKQDKPTNVLSLQLSPSRQEKCPGPMLRRYRACL